MSYQERDFLEKMHDAYKSKLKTDKDGNALNARLTPRGIVAPATPRQIEEVLKKGKER